MFTCKGFKKVTIASEMDLKPFMNLMVVLIPMLLVSAEFAKVAVVDINLPEDRKSGANNHNRQTERPEPKDGLLSLTAIVTDSVLTIGARGGFMPSIAYREYHEYVAKDDQTKFVVTYEPGVIPKHPLSGRMMNLNERQNILLYASDENQNLIKRYYTKDNELLTDGNGKTLASLAAGDTVYTDNNPKRMVVVKNIADFELKPLSVYDELQNRLIKLKQRYRDVKDANEIIIAAENGVLYDKIVQIMDKARAADYPDIMISKLRS